MIFCKGKQGKRVEGMQEKDGQNILKNSFGEEATWNRSRSMMHRRRWSRRTATKQEIQEKIENFRNNKAWRENGITAEIYKVRGQELENS